MMRTTAKARWKKEQWYRPSLKSLLHSYIGESTFIHLSQLGPNNTDRFGINPKQQWNTPFGIYGYPLNSKFLKDLLNQTLPFRQDAPWVHVFKVNLNKCLRVSRYSQDHYNRDVEKLGPRKHLIQAAERDAIHKSPAGFIWNLTRLLSEGKIVAWNRIFRSLDYQGVYDDKGLGIIHKNEPFQIVMFSTTYVKRIDVLPNPSLYVNEADINKPKAEYKAFNQREDITWLNSWRNKEGLWVKTFRYGVEFSLTVELATFQYVECTVENSFTFTLLWDSSRKTWRAREYGDSLTIPEIKRVVFAFLRDAKNNKINWQGLKDEFS